MATLPKSARMQGQSTFWSAEPHASPSASQESASDWMIRVATWPSNILLLLAASGRAGSFGKMSPASFPLEAAMPPAEPARQMDLMTEEMKRLPQATSRPSSPTFGNAGMGSPTEFLTLNMCEFPVTNGPFHSDAGVCSLSDILETGDLPQRFYLSQTACRGILRRAARRGKALPEPLSQALGAVAAMSTTPGTDG